MSDEKQQVEERISNFARALAGLVKCCKMNMGIDLDKKQMVVQDKETNMIGRIDLYHFNNMIENDTRLNQTIEMSAARELIRVLGDAIPYLTKSEADTIMIMIHGALTRMMKESEQDDIHDVSE